MPGGNTKRVSGFLRYNYKDGSLDLRKTKPSKSEQSPYEVLTKIELEVEVPKVEIPTISQRLVIPEHKVIEAVADAFPDDSEYDDLPDPWDLLVSRDPDEIVQKISTLQAGPEELAYLRSALQNELDRWGRDEVIDALETRIHEIKGELAEADAE